MGTDTKKKYVNLDLKSLGMVVALVVIFAIFYVLTGGANATPTNINNLIIEWLHYYPCNRYAAVRTDWIY